MHIQVNMLLIFNSTRKKIRYRFDKKMVCSPPFWDEQFGNQSFNTWNTKRHILLAIIITVFTTCFLQTDIYDFLIPVVYCNQSCNQPIRSCVYCPYMVQYQFTNLILLGDCGYLWLWKYLLQHILLISHAISILTWLLLAKTWTMAWPSLPGIPPKSMLRIVFIEL